MIKFKSVTFKNFQSTGNRPITIELDRSPTTMIAGPNGSGKSNVLEALTYGLFGKPLKKVNLGGLINTINKKNLLVTVDYNVKGVDYKVIRGQKPNVLEFYINGEMVDQSASARDYQTKIEHSLGIDYKMFTQMVVLNKEKYVPFLELTTADRRKIVEDILDISVFSVMSDQLKVDARELNVKVQDAQYALDRTTRSIAAQQRLIQETQQNQQDLVASIASDLAVEEATLAQLEAEHAKLVDLIPDVTNERNDLKAKLAEIEEHKRSIQTLNANIATHNNTAKFLHQHDICPTCRQDIATELKTERLTVCNDEVTELTRHVDGRNEAIRKLMSESSTLSGAISRAQAATGDAQQAHQAVLTQQAVVNRLHKAIIAAGKAKPVSDVDYHQQLDDLVAQQQTEVAALDALLAEMDILSTCKTLLGDGAIKAAVVNEYIDFINTRVNEYLNAMEFYINIKLDGNFNDTIESINREGFTYDNLSTGQKCRVSLAISLALMEVASLKNSAVTNLLMVDEILENLDTQGVSLFMKLVRENLAHKNVFVITQRSDEFADYFRSQITFKSVDGFTEITQ